ncbi:sugar ABC transporter permease [Shinella daejeonensis]|uniref:carbohydrate ABC transporter permease n=1 Tax=Shinella daejeonensis TaxID=659017 RepID=UPI0020C7D4B0|nr:sugar ABC transporter permease [Shinella daejeonensis]MCP8896862.1 sugar ABC transporter permease [Shinella daejeonensis]
MTSISQTTRPAYSAASPRSDGLSTGFYKLLFMTPTILVLALVVAGPLLYSFWLSLHEYIITYGMGDLVWFENYAVMMSDEFAGVSWVTMKLTVIVVVLEFLIAFGLALLLNQSWLKFREIYLLVLMLPILMTPVAVALMFRLMFNPNLGIINWLLSLVGIPQQGWFGDPDLALATVVFVDIWNETSLMLIMLYAGLKSLPQDPVEAARIDGASAFQILWHVTLPMLKPVILVTLLIRMITALKSYDLIYMLTQGGPGKVTETISFYAYRLGFRFLDIGQAAAVSFILLAAVVVLTVVLLRIMREN